MTHHRLLFKLFLITYGGFLLVHVLETRFDSWQLPAGLLGGVAVALVAHRKHGYLPSIFLVGHMFIEWYHHALHGSSYNTSEITFHGIHAVLDIVFLYVEAKEHYDKYALPFLGLIILALIVIFAFNYVSASPSSAMTPLVTQASEVHGATAEHHSHDGGTLHHIVIGGMLGCILSHFICIPKKTLP